MNENDSGDDILDIIFKGRQKRARFIFSKFSFSQVSRTKSAFNETAVHSSNWWDIPYVQKRWNKLICGKETLNYEEYLMQIVLRGEQNLKLLSLGSGTCSHGLSIAEYENFEKITCVDISDFRITLAKKNAREKNLNNIEFICSDVKDLHFLENQFDIVLFNSALHHLRDVESLLANQVSTCLKDSGLLIIKEYVGPNRLQFPVIQIKKSMRPFR